MPIRVELEKAESNYGLSSYTVFVGTLAAYSITRNSWRNEITTGFKISFEHSKDMDDIFFTLGKVQGVTAFFSIGLASTGSATQAKF